MIEPRFKKIEGGTYHEVATCESCDWKDENYLSARTSAIAHTINTGHITQVETGSYSKYRPAVDSGTSREGADETR